MLPFSREHGHNLILHFSLLNKPQSKAEVDVNGISFAKNMFITHIGQIETRWRQMKSAWIANVIEIPPEEHMIE